MTLNLAISRMSVTYKTIIEVAVSIRTTQRLLYSQEPPFSSEFDAVSGNI